ncbi:MAG: response regulator [Micromonosporaceae bacterium]|nr:response regulator [Micromonosporaceae bacterium]
MRVLIVDDHPVVRDGLVAVLGAQPDLEVVGEAGDGEAALAQVAALTPDVALLDLQMPGLSGVDVTAAICARHPVQVLVLTAYETQADITAAVRAGAVGYLLKDAAREQLCDAVRAAARGESVLSPTVAAKLLDHIRHNDREGLSSREIEVLDAVARGQGNKEIARALHVSEATVKTHLLHIYAKLGVADRTAAVTTALQRGLIRLG